MNRLLLSAVLALVARLGAQTTGAAVPASYQDLYDELHGKLTAVEKQIPASGTKTDARPIYAIELTAANANRGEVLLAPRTRQGISLNLAAFQSLGVTGVTIATSFPILVQEFPRSQEYLQFYRSVVEEVRRRGLKLHLKTGAAFVDPVFGRSAASQFFKTLKPETYIRAKRAMIETILRELAPDYLTIDNEPDTTQKNTGLDYSPDRYIEYVRACTKGIDRGKTRIAAGAGTWSPLVYFERLVAETDVDCIDLHIYPINRDFLTGRAAAAADLARRQGKGVIIGEAWPYKVRDRELGSVDFSYPAIFGRDIYSFWAPIDAQFISVIGRWSQWKQAEFVSFFWAQYFFSYVAYEPALDSRPPAELQELGTRAAVPNIVAKRPSPSGQAFTRLTGGSPR